MQTSFARHYLDNFRQVREKVYSRPKTLVTKDIKKTFHNTLEEKKNSWSRHSIIYFQHDIRQKLRLFKIKKNVRLRFARVYVL